MFKVVGKILFLQSLIMISIPINHTYGQLCSLIYTKLWEAFFTIIGTKNMTHNTVWYTNEHQTSAVLRNALFWAITQRAVATACRRFGRTYFSHLCIFFLGFLTLEFGAEKLAQNFGKELPLLIE
jgi:hypothetical protein